MHKLWIYPGCSLRRNPISFWSLQQRMELSQKQKSASPVPGAAWVMQPPARAVSRDGCCVLVREVDEKCCYCLGFFSFSLLLSQSSLHFHYLSAPGRAVSHLTATGLNSEKTCRQSVSHIIIFLPSPLDGKKQLKGTNCVKNSLSTLLLFWAKFQSSLWIWQKQKIMK